MWHNTQFENDMSSHLFVAFQLIIAQFRPLEPAMQKLHFGYANSTFETGQPPS